MSECDVCQGSGYYPIHNRFGTMVFSIKCPECFGAWEPESEAKLKQPITGEGLTDNYFNGLVKRD